MQGPFKVVMSCGLFMSTEVRDSYEEASQMAHNVVEAMPNPKVFVGVYDSNNRKIWSYEVGERTP